MPTRGREERTNRTNEDGRCLGALSPPGLHSFVRPLVIVTFCFVLACSGEDGGPRRGAGTSRPLVSAVQLGSFADSSNAVVLRDSLVRAGWTAYISPAMPGGQMRWRVLVQPSSGVEVPRIIMRALRAQGRDALLVRDSLPRSVSLVPSSVELYRVNRGSEGMLRTLRWALSPDGRSLLVVEDPAGVENEPEPNGFLFVSETGPFIMQVDSVWDVAPSPDWQRLAYGRAYVVMSTRESPDAITSTQWVELAERTGLAVETVRQAAFVSSSMNIAYAIAQPVVVDVSDRMLTTDASPREAERTLAMARGWRLAWTGDGRALAVGTAPEGAVDDADPRRWIVLDTATWEPIAAVPNRAPSWNVEWVEGPLLDISVELDENAPRSVPIDGGRVTSRQGWIRVVRESEPDGVGAEAWARARAEAGADTIAGGRVVAPGMVLAATASGRFVAALVRKEIVERFEVPYRFVIYHIVE